jgi:hypothetical protein
MSLRGVSAIEADAYLRDLERDEDDGSSTPKASQATNLISLALDAGVELWHTQDCEPWATILVEGHTEHLGVSTQAFRLWLQQHFYRQYQKVPGSQALQDALGVLAAKARFDGLTCSVHTRLG